MTGALPPGAVVVLTHGLWVSRHVLFGWRRQFERRGAVVAAFGYPSREPLADNTRRLAAFIEAQAAQTIYVLGHSLGGLLILGLIGNHAGSRIARAVIAGTPVAGSEAARRFARWRYGPWLIGGAQAALEGSGRVEWGPGALPFEVGVIAGTRGIGLGRLVGRLPAPNDGTIPLAETRFAGAQDSIALPLSHSEMLLSARLVDQALAFFAHGSFDHNARSGPRPQA